MTTQIKKQIGTLAKVITLVSLFSLLAMPTAEGAAIVSKSKVRVKPQGLSIGAPASVDMGEIPVDTMEQTVQGVINNIVVTDLRGNKAPLGWSATLTATDFIEDTDYQLKIPMGRMSLDIPSAAQLPAGQSYFRVLAGDGAGVTFFNTGRAFSDANRDGISDPVSLMNALAGRGVGKFDISLLLKVNIPPFNPAGSYTSTLTETVS
ncbi:MAG: hypothetical protein AAB588_05725 [Patescibacteria group bacterium]